MKIISVFLEILTVLVVSLLLSLLRFWIVETPGIKRLRVSKSVTFQVKNTGRIFFFYFVLLSSLFYISKKMNELPCAVSEKMIKKKVKILGKKLKKLFSLNC